MEYVEERYVNSIHHDGSSRYVIPKNAGKIRLGDEVMIRLRASESAPIRRVLIRTCPDGEQFFVEMMREVDPESLTRWWEVSLHISMPVTAYRFLIFSDDGVWWYNGSGAHRHVPTDAEDFRILADYASPDWIPDRVFYQIFPDRFADGDPDNNVRDGEFEYFGQASRSKNWGEPQSNWPAAMVEFYGGDLDGVEQHLDYLEDLGINAIYFNPIFSSYSNHRYDVIDYLNVDPHLGGNKALASLRRITTERDIRLILDIVPNHCGVEHEWFKNAQMDREAPTAEYFSFKNHPDDYECWLGVRSLPKLNYRSQKLREEIYAAPDAIFRHWLREPFSIDGWRVDVANMLARHGKDQLEAEVWAGIRQAVKEENQSAYLLGENFFDSTSQLQGDRLDASMNYAGFTKPLLYWLSGFVVEQHGKPQRVSSDVKWTTKALVDSWNASLAAIPWQVANQQFNLLGSHDTPRISTILGDDPALTRLAAALLFTYVGVPSIYYGDEIGMTGKDSLEARNCMEWDPGKWDGELRAFYQTLIRLRRTSQALIEGGYQVLLVEENVFAYLRDAETDQIIVIANRDESVHPAGKLSVQDGAIPDGTVFVEIMSGKRTIAEAGGLPLAELGKGVQIWRSEK